MNYNILHEMKTQQFLSNIEEDGDFFDYFRGKQHYNLNVQV